MSVAPAMMRAPPSASNPSASSRSEGRAYMRAAQASDVCIQMIEWNPRFVKDPPSGSEDIPTAPDTPVRANLPHRRQRRCDLFERLALGVDSKKPGNRGADEHEKSGKNLAAEDGLPRAAFDQPAEDKRRGDAADAGA